MTESGGERAVHLQLKDAEGRLYELRVHPSHQGLAPAASVIEKNECGNEEANVKCTRCLKSFYNKTALRNHVKMQHVIELEDDATMSDTPQTATFKTEEETITCPPTSSLDPNRLVIASEDISYVIVKTIGAYSSQRAGKYRGPYTSETILQEQKPPTNLVGPFECLQFSTFIPGTICHRIFFDCCEYSLHYRHEHTKRRKPGMRCQVCEKPLDGSLGSGATCFERTCPKCGMRFPDELVLAQHKKVSHAKPKPFHCMVCLKRFTQQSGLMQHIRMHTGYRPFPCTICGKAFTQKAGLDQHLRIHTKIKPFRCVVCDKSFSQSIHLRQHMRTHTHIQPFQCGICGRRFKQSSHLNFHVASHDMDQRILDNGMQKEQAGPEEQVQETIPIQIIDN